MLYNKTSINYYVEIMFLRRLLRQLLRPTWSPRLLARILGLDEAKLTRHRELVVSDGDMTDERWISINTDGPDCPLSRVYSASDAIALLRDAGFTDVRTSVYFFDARHYGRLGRLLPEPMRAVIGRWAGWHRIVEART
jgi:hypothetical protein